MTQRRSFYRKLAYLVAIALLWIPVSLLSQPASLDAQGNRSPGGYLAQLRDRDDYRLSQAKLGDIDPTGETIKLATLGLRGVAVQILWNSAQQYQKVEDWISLAATLEQIIRLQPNFYTVWDFQSHNLSYNISVEFDDYRDRFYWVMRGIDFLKEGVKYNRFDPRFLARIGWVYSNKIGRADEHVQYRRLFRKMQEDKGEKRTDNWLVGYDWFIKSQELVDSGVPLRVYLTGQQNTRNSKAGDRAPSPLLFFSEAPMALINYADTLEEEGTFGDVAKEAWEQASADWQRYANRPVATSHSYSIRLADLEPYQQKIKDLTAQLDALLPGEREKARADKREKLTDDQRRALDKSPAERSDEEKQSAYEAELKLKVSAVELALRASPDKRTQARDLADEIDSLERMAGTISIYRDIVNYDYWWTRCQAEPSDDCLSARELLFLAKKAYANGDLFEARKNMESAFEKWRVVLDRYEVLRNSDIMTDDLYEHVENYRKVLGKIPGAKFPDNFVLQDIVEKGQMTIR